MGEGEKFFVAQAAGGSGLAAKKNGLTFRLDGIIDQQVQAATSSRKDASTFKRHLMAHCWTEQSHTIPVAASVLVKFPKEASEEQRTENSPSMHALTLLRQIRENMAKTDRDRRILLCGDSHYTHLDFTAAVTGERHVYRSLSQGRFAFRPLPNAREKTGAPEVVWRAVADTGRTPQRQECSMVKSDHQA